MGETEGVTKDDEIDAWGGPSVGKAYLERFLLSIIDANPGPENEGSETRNQKSRQQRLRSAMKALFNLGGGVDGRPPDADHAALLWMSEQRSLDLAKQTAIRHKESGLLPSANIDNMRGSARPDQLPSLPSLQLKNSRQRMRMSGLNPNGGRPARNLVKSKISGWNWLGLTITWLKASKRKCSWGSGPRCATLKSMRCPIGQTGVRSPQLKRLRWAFPDWWNCYNLGKSGIDLSQVADSRLPLARLHGTSA